MRTSPAAQCTDFARDILGRFVCNGLDEALCSADGQLHSDPRPFDLIILGGGAIGAALAHQLFVADRAHNHRTLLLEAGPFTIPDHVQNLPMLGLAVPEPSSIADLRTRGQHATARDEVWGLPWHSDETFPGLAYCLGGRSLFSGGWSPSPLDGELQAWPAEVAESLSDHYFAPAAQQMGVHLRNDFLNGDLHKALRLRLFQGLRGVRGAIPPREIPHHLAHPPSARPHDVSKLDAPLAVQASERSGRHPLRRFSGVPALIQAARAAWVESDGDDARKRLMIVPHCHVERLITENGRVKWVQTNQGSVPVLNRGRVILALGTIESARLALESFAGMAHADQIGRHLMAHLRSTVVIRLPYESLPQLRYRPPGKGLQTAALLVRGRHPRGDGANGHFRLQITAAGLETMGRDARDELFRLMPDLDTIERFYAANERQIIVVIRGFAEMLPTPGNRVELDSEWDEFGRRRAFVSLRPSPADLDLWDAMDRAIDDVVGLLAHDRPFEVMLTPRESVRLDPAMVEVGEELPRRLPSALRRDGLGATHTEAGTLRMGADLTTSVTNMDGRFHQISNAYAIGPAVFPAIGSFTPMLTGIAMVRRTADILLKQQSGFLPLEPGYAPLFDGTEDTAKRWQMIGEGRFNLMDGALVMSPGDKPGLLYFAFEPFGDFILRLQFRLHRPDDGSGVLVRLADPLAAAMDCDDEGDAAIVAARTGFEAQIDELARGAPRDGLPEHRTGAIYGIPIGPGAGQQVVLLGCELVQGTWYDYEIRVVGDTYTVLLNDQQTAEFTNTDRRRGVFRTGDCPSGYIGLQAHIGYVAFRHIRIKALSAS